MNLLMLWPPYRKRQARFAAFATHAWTKYWNAFFEVVNIEPEPVVYQATPVQRPRVNLDRSRAVPLQIEASSPNSAQRAD